MTLLQEIQAACTPEEIAAGNYHAIAAKVNAARVASGAKQIVQPRLVGKGTISDALGVPAGPVFIYSIKAAALAALPAEPTETQIAEKAMLELAWELIDAANFDVGLSSTRAGLDLFVGKLPGFTQAAANAIKALAEKPADEVTWNECATALGA